MERIHRTYFKCMCRGKFGGSERPKSDDRRQYESGEGVATDSKQPFIIKKKIIFISSDGSDFA